MNSRTIYYYSFSIITALFVLSLLIRMGDHTSINNIRNIQASYHTILTVKALNENKASDHLYLPTVTLGGENNHHIKWGATVATQNGSFIYTSFYSPSFLLAKLYFKITNLSVSIHNLFYLNVFIGYLTSIILAALLIYIVNSKASLQVAVFAVVGACTISIFSAESLLSTGIVYWAQSVFNLYQSIALLTLAIFIRNGNTKWWLLSLAFIGPLIEWTGFIYNIGLFFVFYFYLKNRPMAKLILLITLFSGLFLVSHYVLALGPVETVDAIIGRFNARSATSEALVISDLPNGYMSSYGLFLVIFIFSCGFASHFLNEKSTRKTSSTVLTSIIIMSLVPLLENLVMLQHASEFSFDRLKFIFPFAIICVLTLLNTSKIRYVIYCFLILASYSNVTAYLDLVDNSKQWNETVHNRNLAIANDISKHVDLSCVHIVTNANVRGYFNGLFHRAIVESTPKEEMWAQYPPNSCGLLYILANYEENDSIRLNTYSIHKDPK